MVRILYIKTILFLCCIGRHRMITTTRFENPVRDVAHGDGVGSQNTQTLGKSRYYKQTQFHRMRDVL